MPKHTLMVPVTLHNDCSTAFEAALQKLIRATRQEKGCCFYKSFRISETQYCFFEEWEDDEAMAAHNDSPHLKQFFEETSSLIKGELKDVNLFEIQAD